MTSIANYTCFRQPAAVGVVVGVIIIGSHGG